jgi:hypothetical protein
MTGTAIVIAGGRHNRVLVTSDRSAGRFCFR